MPAEEAKRVLEGEELATWPAKGNITYKDVTLRYRPECDLVLKGTSFEIKGGEKIGVVGRTGAGKSTIIQSISRIVEIEDGTMEIDGVKTTDIPISQLRDQVTVIPQDPTLFSGSLRFNVDPTGKVADAEILDLLKRAGLERLLTRERTTDEDERGRGRESRRRRRQERQKLIDFSDSEPESSSSSESEEDEDDKELKQEINGPLDMSVSEGGDNLSSGEKQLLCICRAILRKRRIIILDEATANIDLITEQKIQKLIKTEFKDQTMIVIAHRLQTIIESDKVMVLGDGKVLEMDAP